jgi:predicted Fe-Mo cluster-binding NifX family protein
LAPILRVLVSRQQRAAGCRSLESLMKLAIMLYGTRVSPRFGFSQRALIVDIDGRRGHEILRRAIGVRSYHPEQIPEMLSKEEVELVIAGGMNQYFQDLFRDRGIQVVWGIIGDVEDVLAAYRADRLSPGMGCCRQPTRTRRRFRAGIETP